MATMVLTVAGTALGGPLGGAIGAMLGQVVDNHFLFRPGSRQGARLSDLRLQTSRYGDAVPKIFGSMRVAGTVIWATDLIERSHRQSGGKGQPGLTTYSYSASFAVALSSRRVRAVRRIWADGNLLRGAAGDFKSALGAFRFYPGGEDQTPDPLIAAQKGVAATPACNGIAYAVFEDLQLTDFGNRIPSLTFELEADEGEVAVASIAHELSRGAILADVDAALMPVRGYAADGDTVSDALTSLVQAMDAVLRTSASGVSLTQGERSDAVVETAMQGAGFNGSADPGMTLSRGSAEDVPVRFTIRHYDPARDYQAGVQSADRAGAGRIETSLDLPAALSAPDARKLAEMQMMRAWTGRAMVDVRCDWSALTLEPGMIVSLEKHEGRWRIEESEWEAMGVRLRLRRMGALAVPDLPASGGDGVFQPDAMHGPTRLIVAEVPSAGTGAATAPVLIVAAAGTSPGWRMAELFVEDGATGGLTSLGRSAPPAIMGHVSVLPRQDAPAALMDTASVVEVDLLHGAMELLPVDDGALLAGANRALLGDEVIQFGHAEQIGPARWRISRLLRGRRGTEQARLLHQQGERFLLLETERLVSVPDAYIRIGADLRIGAIGIGDTEQVRAAVRVSGLAIVPLSPVHLNAFWKEGAWHIGWTRRSRQGWDWPDGADTPLGEEQELYRITLSFNGMTFRSVDVAAPQWSYAAAMIAGDRVNGVAGDVVVGIRQIGTYGAGALAETVVAI